MEIGPTIQLIEYWEKENIKNKLDNPLYNSDYYIN